MEIPPPQLQMLSYATQPAGSWRGVVKIMAWVCIAWGACQLLIIGLLASNPSFRFSFTVQPGSWARWIETILALLDALAMVSGGILLLVNQRAGCFFIAAGAVVDVLLNLSEPILFKYVYYPGLMPSWLEFASNMAYQLSHSAFPALLFIFSTRRNFRDAITAS